MILNTIILMLDGNTDHSITGELGIGMAYFMFVSLEKLTDIG